MSTKRKIILRLIGGLGNQLFQLQYALLVQKKIGGQIIIDKSFLEKSHKKHEKLAIKKIIYQYPIIKLNWVDLKLRRFFERLITKFNLPKPKFLKLRFIFEKSKINKQLKPMIILDGFWQNSVYLNKIFLEKLRYYLFDVRSKKKNNNFICVHIRRGDYVTNKQWFIRHQLVLSKNYYTNCFKYFSKKIKNPVYEVYTDDENWAKNNFRKIDNLKVLPTNKLEPFKLLEKMSLYQNYIIANSSLSWWAAVISPAQYKKVLIPKKWDRYNNSSKLKMKNWIKV
jgi:hypothetical protein